jgi:protein-arginine kinase activator protein McsA
VTRCFKCQDRIEGEVETVKVVFSNGNEAEVPICDKCRKNIIFSRSFDFWNNSKDDEVWGNIEERESGE